MLDQDKEERQNYVQACLTKLENSFRRVLSKAERKVAKKQALKDYRQWVRDGKTTGDGSIPGINLIIKSRLSKDANPVDHFVHLVLRWNQLLDAGGDYKVVACNPTEVQCPGLSLGEGVISHCDGKVEETTKLLCCPTCGGSGLAGGMWILAQRIEDNILCAFELVVFQYLDQGLAEIVCVKQYEHTSTENSDVKSDNP